MKRCSVCNTTYNDAQTFCLTDGAALLAIEPETVQSDASARRKSRNYLFLLLSGLFLAGVTAAVLFLLNMTGQKADPGSTNKQTVVVTNSQQTQSPATAPAPSPIATPTQTPAIEPSVALSPEIAVVSNSNANQTPASSPKTSAENANLNRPALMKIEDHSIVFNLQQCRKSGTAITCEFSLTNTGQDRRFKLVASRSNLYDELGNGYDGRSGQLANENGGEPRITFIAGVTTKARVTFEGIDPNATKITLLRIQYDVGDDYGLEVKFRSVPLLNAK